MSAGEKGDEKWRGEISAFRWLEAFPDEVDREPACLVRSLATRHRLLDSLWPLCRRRRRQTVLTPAGRAICADRLRLPAEENQRDQEIRADRSSRKQTKNAWLEDPGGWVAGLGRRAHRGVMDLQ